MRNTYTLNRGEPTLPPVETVTLTLSVRELAALRVLVGGAGFPYLTTLCKELGNGRGKPSLGRKAIADLALSLTTNDYIALFTQLNVIAHEIVEVR